MKIDLQHRTRDKQRRKYFSVLKKFQSWVELEIVRREKIVVFLRERAERAAFVRRHRRKTFLDDLKRSDRRISGRRREKSILLFVQPEFRSSISILNPWREKRVFTFFRRRDESKTHRIFRFGQIFLRRFFCFGRRTSFFLQISNQFVFVRLKSFPKAKIRMKTRIFSRLNELSSLNSARNDDA